MFVRFENDMIVNLDYILYIDENIIKLIDGIEILLENNDVEVLRTALKTYNRYKIKYSLGGKNE